MAYPYPYFPQTYQPTYQQAFQPAQQTQNIIWVSGDQEAQMYPIAPNNAVALWGRDGKTLYLKSADMTGRPSLKVYDLAERTERASDAVSGDGGKTTPDYATKDDLGRVVGMVRGFEERLKKMEEGHE